MNKKKIQKEYHELREQMFDLLLEEARNDFQHKHKLESFETQAENFKAGANLLYDNYLERIHHGYQVILNEIALQSRAKK